MLFSENMLLRNNPMLLFVTKKNLNTLTTRKYIPSNLALMSTNGQKEKSQEVVKKLLQNCVLLGQKKMDGYQNFEDFVSFNA